jgi:large subunit ribosomal protein L35
LLSSELLAITRGFNRRRAALGADGTAPDKANAQGMPSRRNLGKGWKMPKLKTKSGAKKRFGRTATGMIKRNWGHKRHRLISKSKDGKRLRRGTTTMERGDAKLVLTYMPYLRS